MSEFSLRKQIESRDDIRLMDRDSNFDLDLFCYTNCNNESEEIIKQSRGVVFNKDTLIMKAFSYTDEYSGDQIDQIESLFHGFNFTKYKFFDSYEGSLLRLFFYKGKWFLTTHKKLDAFKSKWSSRESFGVHFVEAIETEIKNNEDLRQVLPPGEDVLDRFFATLDTNNQYMFLILTRHENRIVCDAFQQPKVLHVGTFVDGCLDLNYNIHVSRPESKRFLNIDELVHYIESCDHKKTQGVICFGENNRQVKIVNSKYRQKFLIRGNEQSIKYRYLQLRSDRDQVDVLKEMYPEYIKDFERYENTLIEVAKSIHVSYQSRYINREPTFVYKPKFLVMKACHEWHCFDRKNNRVSLKQIINELNKQSPTSLNLMIKNHNSPKKFYEPEPLLRGSFNPFAMDAPPIREPRTLQLN